MRPNADASILGLCMIKTNPPEERKASETCSKDSAPVPSSVPAIHVHAASPLPEASRSSYQCAASSHLPSPYSLAQMESHPSAPVGYTTDGSPVYQTPQVFYHQPPPQGHPHPHPHQVIYHQPPTKSSSTLEEDTSTCHQSLDGDIQVYQQMTLNATGNFGDISLLPPGSWVNDSYTQPPSICTLFHTPKGSVPPQSPSCNQTLLSPPKNPSLPF